MYVLSGHLLAHLYNADAACWWYEQSTNASECRVATTDDDRSLDWLQINGYS